MKKRRLFSIMLLIGLVVGISSTLTSCKDYDGDSEWKESIATQYKTLDEALAEQVRTLTQAREKCERDCNARMNKLWADSINMNYNDIVTLKEDIKKLKDADSILTKSIADHLYNDSIGFDSINAKLAQAISDNNTTANKVSALVNTVDSIDSVLSEAIVAQDIRITELERKAYADSLTFAKADSLNAAAIALVKEDIKGINSRLATVGELAEKNEKAIQQLEERVSDLEDEVEQIEKSLYYRVSSININGTVNPVFGYYAAPTGDVRSTILGAYYGTPTGFTFPRATRNEWEGDVSTADINRANLNRTITVSDGQTIVTNDGSYGNAGDLYVTLNPTNIGDFTGKKFTVVNSRGDIYDLGQLSAVASNYELTFGYTRAASSNGFYNIKATISPENVESFKPRNFDANELKEEAKEIYRNWRDRADNGGMKINASELAGVLYKNFNGALPALALKTTWTDPLTEEETSVLSQYSLAAVAMHPLSFGTLAGKTYSPMPTYSSLEDLNFDIDDITINPIPNGTYTVTVKTYDEATNSSKDTTITLEAINDIIRDINNTLRSTQDQVNNELNSIDSQVSDKLSDLTSIVKRYNSWADRVNNWFSRDGNNGINRALQPVLFYGSGKGLSRVGTSKAGLANLKSNDPLLATTFTLELIAPAYKKWVAVTNAWPNNTDAINNVNSDADAIAKANGGTNMNKVIDGTIRRVNLGTIKKGTVYEITYGAVDYNGVQRYRKYYFIGD